jgi:hypothetical protein
MIKTIFHGKGERKMQRTPEWKLKMILDSCEGAKEKVLESDEQLTKENFTKFMDEIINYIKE